MPLRAPASFTAPFVLSDLLLLRSDLTWRLLRLARTARRGSESRWKSGCGPWSANTRPRYVRSWLVVSNFRFMTCPCELLRCLSWLGAWLSACPGVAHSLARLLIARPSYFAAHRHRCRPRVATGGRSPREGRRAQARPRRRGATAHAGPRLSLPLACALPRVFACFDSVSRSCLCSHTGVGRSGRAHSAGARAGRVPGRQPQTRGPCWLQPLLLSLLLQAV